MMCVIMCAFLLFTVLSCSFVLVESLHNESLIIYEFKSQTKINRSAYNVSLDLYYDRCDNINCISKCCPEGQIFNENRACHYSDSVIEFQSINGFYNKDKCDFNDINECQRMELSGFNNFDTIFYGKPNCTNLIDFDINEVILLTTGSVYILNENMEFKSDSNCIELFERDNTTVLISLVCVPSEAISEPVREELSHNYIGMFVSVAFLLATFLVYAILSELRNLHGKSLMNHCAALGTGYFFLATIQMDVDEKIPIKACIAFSYIVIFAFLSSFFWLNVMCFDIWWVFSGYRPPAAGSKKELEKKKFLFYSIYSWGLATLIFVIILVMEMPWIPKHFIRPEFGYDRCWFKTPEAEFYYFYLPLAFILSSNLLFFILTSCRILKISNETKVLTRGENKRHEEHERKRFVLYLKLFVVMGINWIAELLSFFYPNLKNLWFITDASNTLQGVFIFLIFVWKRRILRLLKLKFRSIFLSNDGLSKRPSKSTSLMTHQTSITSTSDSIKMKSASSFANMNVSKTPM